MPKQYKILIVDDELPLLKILVEKFTREGFDVVQAHNGEEGLEVAKKETPDIALLDVMMPKLDGLAMLEILRKEAWGKNLPVIMLTNLSDPKKVGIAMASGAYNYLVKTDWHINDVVEKVRSMLVK